MYHVCMQKRIGIYAGSFDPPTNGHLWMIRRGAAIFDELVVVLAVNPEKRGFLPPPKNRRYSVTQLCRIIHINMLRSVFLIKLR